jgi:antitoxin component of MazEF toxin-antitoxin module
MIQSTQKIITIGSSQGVTLPKKELQSLGLKPGDTVKVTVEPDKSKLGNLAERLDKFMADYDQDLKNLANR